MVYEDRARPRGLLRVLFLGFAAFWTSLWVFAFGAATVGALGSGNVAAALVLSAFLMFGLGIVTAIVHGAYHTEYRIDDRVVRLRLGVFRGLEIPLEEVIGVERTGGFAGGWITEQNRYFGFGLPTVVLETTDGSFWATPTDADGFVEELRQRLRGAGNVAGTTNHIQ